MTEHLLLLVRWRRVIVTNVLVVAVATAVISLVVPSWYTATGSLLPSEAGASDAGVFSMIESTFPLLGIPGVSAPSEVMVAILRSRTVAEEVIRANDLERIYRSRTIDHAVEALEKRVKMDVTENGVVRIRAEARDPERAARMVETFVDALERYNLEVRSTTGKKTREFVERRLLETTRELRRSEEELTAFQREHASIEIGEQARAAIASLADLEAEAIAAEIQLGIIRSYASESHPDARRLESRIREYREALGALREGSGGPSAPGGGISRPRSPTCRSWPSTWPGSRGPSRSRTAFTFFSCRNSRRRRFRRRGTRRPSSSSTRRRRRRSGRGPGGSSWFSSAGSAGW